MANSVTVVLYYSKACLLILKSHLINYQQQDNILRVLLSKICTLGLVWCAWKGSNGINE